MFLKHAGVAGLTLLIPASVSLVYSCFRNIREHGDETSDFKSSLEKYFESSAGHENKPDVLIFNANSLSDYDFVFLKYDREVNDEPVVVFLKDDSVTVRDRDELEKQVRVLKDISHRHDIFIFCEADIKEWFIEVNDSASAEQYFPELIQRIRECGMYNEISEELYRPVSVVYMKKYKHEHDKNKGIT